MNLARVSAVLGIFALALVIAALVTQFLAPGIGGS
jgi:hypothetical protein